MLTSCEHFTMLLHLNALLSDVLLLQGFVYSFKFFKNLCTCHILSKTRTNKKATKNLPENTKKNERNITVHENSTSHLPNRIDTNLYNNSARHIVVCTALLKHQFFQGNPSHKQPLLHETCFPAAIQCYTQI